MPSEQTIQPINVAAATFLVQLLFLAILGIAERFRSNRTDVAQSPEQSPPLMFLSVASFAVLALANDFYQIWSPLFPGLSITTISTSTAVLLVQLMNLSVVTYLMLQTGCSENSPYTAALFTIPALGIFLRMPPWVFITLTVLSAISYLWLFNPRVAWGRRRPQNRSATAFMNIGCLLLATLTGYVTRPVPITEFQSKPTSRVGTANEPDRPVPQPSTAAGLSRNTC